MAQLTKDEILDLIKKGFIFGDKNQVLAANGNNTSEARYIDMLVKGAFVSTDAQLAAAKEVFVSQSTIFGEWKRASYGLDTAGLGNPVPSNTIPGVPAQTNSWAYNSGTDTINSTLNSSSYITFVSPEKYSTYTHSLTVGASGNDNDYITTVIAYVEDEDDMVANNAYGLDPATYPGINTTDQFIANQHTLSLIRSRTTQANFPFTTSTRYAIVYDMCKLTQRILVNGETTYPSMLQSTADFGAGASCDIKVIREGDIIKTYTTNWTDSAGGKGALGFELIFDLSSNSLTNKFRGSASYGYGALSQNDAFFNNIQINPNRNVIYDLRDGDKWTANNSGVYSLDSTYDLYTDFGVNRFFYNPVTLETNYVNPDKTFELVGDGSTGAGGRFGIEDNTSDVDRTVDMQNNALDVSGMSYFNLDAADSPQTFRSYVYGDNSGTYILNKTTGVGDAAVNLQSSSNEASFTVTKPNATDGGIKSVSFLLQPYYVDGIVARLISSKKTSGASLESEIQIPYVEGTHVLPFSVSANGGTKAYADSTGNIDLTVSGGGGGAGTVTSVGLQFENVIYATGATNSPVTGSGVLQPVLKTQAANTVLAGPGTGGAAAAPTFRVLNNADISSVTGLLTSLSTTDKTTLVAALNEVLAKVDANYITINQRIASSSANFNQTII